MAQKEVAESGFVRSLLRHRGASQLGREAQKPENDCFVYVTSLPRGY